MTERERQQAIRLRLAGSAERNLSVLPTGLAALDAALAGGLPRGAIVELFGPPASGKTTLALEIVARCQKNGATAAWLDAEHAFDAAYAAALGVRLEELPLAQPGSAEQAFEMARTLAGSGALDLLVVDSAAALAPRLELESGWDAGAGLQSRVFATGLRKLAQDARRSGTVALFLNQTRSRGPASSGEDSHSAGGAPLKLYASLRLALGGPQAGRLIFRIVKSKTAGALRTGELARGESGRLAESP